MIQCRSEEIPLTQLAHGSVQLLSNFNEITEEMLHQTPSLLTLRDSRNMVSNFVPI